MRRWIIGFVLALAAAVAGLAFVHTQLSAQLQQVTKLTEQLTELTEQLAKGQEKNYRELRLISANVHQANNNVSLANDVLRQMSGASSGLDDADLLSIHNAIFRTLEGCLVLADHASIDPPNRYRIECPGFQP